MKISQNKDKAELKKMHTRLLKVAKYAKILQFLMICWLVYKTLV